MTEPRIETELGKLPAAWHVAPLGDYLSDAQYGASVKGGKSGSYPILRMTNQVNGSISPANLQYVDISARELETFRVQRGDILFNRTNSFELVGRTAIFDLDGDYVFASYLIRLRTLGAVLDPFFLNVYLNAAETQRRLKSIATRAVSQSNISASRLRKFVIPVPPMVEQRKIAAVVGQVRQALVQQERLIALTAALKNALLHQLFTSGLRGEPQKQTDIGPVPESWDVRPLRDVLAAQLQNGAFVRRHQFGDGVCFANVVDMYRDTHLDLARVERVRVEPSSARRYSLKEGDVLIVRSSLKREGIGQNCVVGKLTERAIYDCHLIRVTPDQKKIIPEFLSAYWRSPVGRLDLIQRSKTVTMTTINQMGISGALVPCPNISEQRDIVDLLMTIESKANLHLRVHTALTHLFHTLLHQLMTAQIRVNDLNLHSLEEPT